MTYASIILTALLAIFTWAKDWNAHKRHWRRIAVIALIVCTAGIGIWNSKHTDTKNAHEREVLNIKIDELKTQNATDRKTLNAQIGALQAQIANQQAQSSEAAEASLKAVAEAAANSTGGNSYVYYRFDVNGQVLFRFKVGAAPLYGVLPDSQTSILYRAIQKMSGDPANGER